MPQPRASASSLSLEPQPRTSASSLLIESSRTSASNGYRIVRHEFEDDRTMRRNPAQRQLRATAAGRRATAAGKRQEAEKTRAFKFPTSNIDRPTMQLQQSRKNKPAGPPTQSRCVPSPCLCLVPRASCLVPRAFASCLVPCTGSFRTSAPHRVVRHELKTTARCGATLPSATRARNRGREAPRSGENPGL